MCDLIRRSLFKMGNVAKKWIGVRPEEEWGGGPLSRRFLVGRNLHKKGKNRAAEGKRVELHREKRLIDRSNDSRKGGKEI